MSTSQPRISRIETGPPIRDLDTLAYWARVLRIPPELLWFDMPGSTRLISTADDSAASGAERTDSQVMDAAVESRSRPSQDVAPASIDPMTHAASKAAVLKWALIPEVGNPVVIERVNSSRAVNPADAESLHAMQCSLTDLDAEHGGGAVLEMAMAYLRSEVAPLLQVELLRAGW